MKKILIIITLMFSSILYANPAPFGLEIHKTTLKEAQEKYTLIDNGINYYSKGPMYTIKNSELPLDASKVTLIFSKDENILLYVSATFKKSKFESLYENLSKKYKLIVEERPFVGNQYAEYTDDQTIIHLYAPHMSFDSTVEYIFNEFDKFIEETDKKDNSKKNENELESL
ncbi:hypothetical protein J3U31_06480 [Gilliamella sp. B3486]|uniref:hypothetical protein n=1 Tax=unclassified Gilliamella TaxID=2685620 RepID=UPI00226AA534|nr:MULTISPECIES: hypothetical protein [unclassified Gilliamella]MCX8597579.1 hypothetical protein [Gilliamella sp. B3493]MCX8599253.1 hypothetical protein [Gilliamella sp. B3486]MCX8705242.1 hypothetical protein [Gilliamella sp. B3127]